MRLKHIASVAVSPVDKKSSPDEMRVQLCNYTDVYYRDTITGAGEYMTATATATEVSTYRLRAGQTLITKDSETAEDIGVAAFVEASAGHLVCGYHLAQITPAAEMIEPKYLYWAIRSQHRSQMSLRASCPPVRPLFPRSQTCYPGAGTEGNWTPDHLDEWARSCLNEVLTQQVELSQASSIIDHGSSDGELEIPGVAA